MTLIEIIKTSLLGFSALFVLMWIFFYLFLKIKKSNKQIEENVQPETLPAKKVVQKPVYHSSPVFVQPVIYPSINRMNQPSQLNINNNHRNYYYENHSPRVEHKPKVFNRPEKFVVFNNRQYGFYNV